MFDFARLLITTKILKKLNVLEDIWVIGHKYTIQIIEDLEFGLVEDACTVEYEDDHQLMHCKLLCVNDDEPLVETLVSQLNQDWVKEKQNVLEGEVVMKNYDPGRGAMVYRRINYD
jgi:hypothetical protein